jgi:hypothetical protein
MRLLPIKPLPPVTNIFINKMCAVVDGFEPPSGDSIDNTTLASWWSTPYYQSISWSTPTRQVGAFAERTRFATLQFRN